MKNVYGYSEDGATYKTQKEMVKAYLIKSGARLSHAECAKKFGFLRLSALIFEIKKDLIREGDLTHVVRSEVMTGINRYDNSCRWKEYWIETV